MAECARDGELEAVRFNVTRLWAGSAACAVAVLLGITALAASAGTPTRRALLDQLQQAATPRPAPSGPGLRVIRRAGGGYLVTVALTPNRPGGPNGVLVRLARNGRPLTGARVTITFSMPSMKMWNAYTADLTVGDGGRYATTIPVIGMTGRWRLWVDIAPRVGTAFRVTVDDRMLR